MIYTIFNYKTRFRDMSHKIEVDAFNGVIIFVMLCARVTLLFIAHLVGTFTKWAECRRSYVLYEFSVLVILKLLDLSNNRNFNFIL